MQSADTHRFGEPLRHHDSKSARMELELAEHQRHLELTELRSRRTLAYAIGRVLLAVLFIASGLVKASHFDGTVRLMIDNGFRDAPMLLSVTIFAEVVGGIFLALGLATRKTAVVLISYLAVVTFLMHHDLALEANRAQATVNLALVGALLMLVGHGGGAESLDALIARRRKHHI